MLVFTRKRHEAIMIGDGVEVRVLRVGRDGVRLGVTAPHSVAVHRLEVYEQIRQENRQAAGAIAAVGELASRVRRIASAAIGSSNDAQPAATDIPSAQAPADRASRGAAART